ncbi:MAG: hypothetical protein A3D74_00355 [Candidatus Levybacteria bacterium RIFCSPHIGHO2_02_FULL_37_13]|nr:MAG: hypothetical protein A3D74_00355 [Candidatus Levybacteria bacterium RIFCSPHIGHO2_02_FULL_37_13]OGH37376.1 MAG: hypothetical protein A3B41_03170 [Candidatus Levybacteria bacterium RIFCSPLOWO2_01_FULL_37_26]
MKIIVTHSSPDMDAITSVWLIRKFLQGWENATVKFVPAGERLARGPVAPSSRIPSPSVAGSLRALDGTPSSRATPRSDAIEGIGEDEVIHVDTGLGPLDHHQTESDEVCGASLTWDFVKSQKSKVKSQKSEKEIDKENAIDRMVRVVVDTDHFKEVFWPNPTADHYEFSVGAALDGLKLAKPNQDQYYVDFISECLDAILHEFENRIWAEKEIATNGQKFETRFGKGIGFETINDSVIKLAQKMGYVIVVRKDPRKGYVRIKAMPNKVQSSKLKVKSSDIDLTLAYEKLSKMDPEATWFLHIGKKMLLNGSVKNPKMRPTTLSLEKIIDVLKKV